VDIIQSVRWTDDGHGVRIIDDAVEAAEAASDSRG